VALWICEGCTTAYAVGAPRCPHCQSTDYREEGDMPKISAHGGATNAAEDEPQADGPVTDDTPEEEPSPGNSSETSSEKALTSQKRSASADRSRARTTANPS
jgi:hypothetical protein